MDGSEGRDWVGARTGDVWMGVRAGDGWGLGQGWVAAKVGMDRGI